MMTIKVPALRFGEEYHSLDQHQVVDLGSGEALASIGLVRESLVAADCRRGGCLTRGLEALQSIPVRDRIKMVSAAADIFENNTLECGGLQTPDDYHGLVALTSGLTMSMARENTGRITDAMRMTEQVMDGLSGGMPLDVYDHGATTWRNNQVRIIPRIEALGVCLPNNSPGVNVIWTVCPGFGIPVLIRPGSSEPFTPFRLIKAFIEAGFPGEAFGYYPCNYAAANRIPSLTKGAIVFGSDETVRRWASNPLVQVHGSGFSKVIVGEDLIAGWKDSGLDHELAHNVSANSGRSCFAASRIMVPREASEIAKALAKVFWENPRLHPRSLFNAEGSDLSAMTMPERAKAINEEIEAGLAMGGAVDVSAKFHGEAGRLVEFEGRTYLLPTVIHCGDNDHPLANKEYLFPFVAVVESSNDDAFSEMGPTLSLAVYTTRQSVISRAIRSQARLVSVNLPTSNLDRRQPHEENLFDLLFERRSLVVR